MKHSLPRLTTLLVAGFLLQAPLFAQDAKPAAKPAGKSGAVATVNGVAIPVARAVRWSACADGDAAGSASLEAALRAHHRH